MTNRFQAQWVSRNKAHAIKRASPKKDAVLLDTFKGIIVIEPKGKRWGDGPVLSADEADLELQPAWHYDPMARIREARRRLGLDGNPDAAG
jgi:hypothetical protein